MKKVILFIFIIFCFSYANSFALDNNIKEKIDLLYEKDYSKLNEISNNIGVLTDKYKNNIKIKTLLVDMSYYINFKLKNKEFYSNKVSENLRNSVLSIINNSFSDLIVIEKLNDLKNKKYENYIDIEYLDYYTIMTEVGILLNHQNFEGAKKIMDSYFEEGNSNRIDFIIKNIEYEGFTTFVQFFSWYKGDDVIDELLKKRYVYYQEEKNSAFYNVRQYGYKGLDCDLLEALNVNDIIDKKFCKLLNGNFEPSDIEDVDIIDSNLQFISDKGNYFGYIVIYYPKYKDELYEKQKEIGEQIIDNDKNFINGYLLILNYNFHYSDIYGCEKFNEVYDNMIKNYIGDSSKRNIIENRKTRCEN